MTDLRPELVRIREEAGLVQQDIAEAWGLKSHVQVSKIENMKSHPDLAQASVWADRCGYDLVLVRRASPEADSLGAMLVHVAPDVRALVYSLLRVWSGATPEQRGLIGGVLELVGNQVKQRARSTG